MRGLLRTAWLPVFVLLLGCGSKSDLVPVSGRVMMDNQPLAKANVQFSPMDQANKTVSSATTDEDGYFKLSASLPNGNTAEGAVVGKYTVRISLFDHTSEEGKPAHGQQVPAKYNSKSELTFDVPAGGTKEANFNLTKKKK